MVSCIICFEHIYKKISWEQNRDDACAFATINKNFLHQKINVALIFYRYHPQGVTDLLRSTEDSFCGAVNQNRQR